MHRQAKAAIARWAEAQRDLTHIDVEKPIGDRVADVLLTGWAGQRIAVEVQYSAITLTEWARRTDSYLAQGVQPCWLFGHLDHHRPRSGTLRDVHRAVAERGWPILWINPIDLMLAVATDGGDGAWLPGSAAMDVGFFPLDAAVLTQDGLFPPGWDAAAARGQARVQRSRQLGHPSDTARIRSLRDKAAQRKAERKEAEERKSAALAERLANIPPLTERQRRIEELHHKRLREEKDAGAQPRPVQPTPSVSPAYRCSRCGGRLADVLQASRVHVGDCLARD